MLRVQLSFGNDVHSLPRVSPKYTPAARFVKQHAASLTASCSSLVIITWHLIACVAFKALCFTPRKQRIFY